MYATLDSMFRKNRFYYSCLINTKQITYIYEEYIVTLSHHPQVGLQSHFLLPLIPGGSAVGFVGLWWSINDKNWQVLRHFVNGICCQKVVTATLDSIFHKIRFYYTLNVLFNKHQTNYLHLYRTHHHMIPPSRWDSSVGEILEGL